MGAPKGNKNAVGNSGGKPGRSGHPTIPESREKFKLLADAIFSVHNRDELLKKIEGGEYSIFDAVIAKALAGNTQAQLDLIKLIFPQSTIVDYYERSQDQEILEMSDDKYRRFIKGEYQRLGIGKRPKARSKK